MNNYSKQREIILEVIKNNRTHPTAEEIYILVTKKEPKISRSTVYRNINILVEKGIIETIATGPDRYDYLYEEHYHAICKVCGKAFDFYYKFEKDNLISNIKKQTNVDIDINSITINGICEKCKSKMK